MSTATRAPTGSSPERDHVVRQSRGRQAAAALIVVALCLGVGALGAVLTASSVSTWYPTLSKPAWNPPSSVFGPVWTALYIAMAMAYWLVWKARGFGAHRATTLFAVQLGLNLLWSGLFFGLRRPDWALLEIVVLLGAIALTAVEFRKHSRLAAALLVPYLLWVAYATSLNAAIAWLNR
jgi:tryptophan-rich sensory protein